MSAGPERLFAIADMLPEFADDKPFAVVEIFPDRPRGSGLEGVIVDQFPTRPEAEAFIAKQNGPLT